MKLKTLANLCKSKGSFCLYDRVNGDGEIVEQWLGTHSAIYPLPSLPLLTEENLIAMFDITSKQKDSLFIRREQLPKGLCYENQCYGERILDTETLTLEYNNKNARPVFTRDGLEFIDVECLSPLADIADLLELYERRTEDDRVYFAAKMGLIIVGIIMPLNLIQETFVNEIEKLVSRCRMALDLKKIRQAERERINKEADGQQSLDEEGDPL